ncbi:MAG: hypothetical protein JNK05_13375 [Myxococcales bacterium]|nr:hypothetical protein [Myxococcales bacterium]
MSRRTIIDAVVEVLAASKEPLTAQQIYQRITDGKLYEFKAKDPVSVMRSAIRKALKDADTSSSRIEAIDRDRFRVKTSGAKHT